MTSGETTLKNPAAEIDNLIAAHPDWRGALLARLRGAILEVDPGIVEEWKWMGSPVWEHTGILCVGNIFKGKVKLGFMDGASLSGPETLFNSELEGNKRRSIDYFETDEPDIEALQNLIREAIRYNEAKIAARAAAALAKKAAARAAKEG